jgi:hypothetical protein
MKFPHIKKLIPFVYLGSALFYSISVSMKFKCGEYGGKNKRESFLKTAEES